MTPSLVSYNHATNVCLADGASIWIIGAARVTVVLGAVEVFGSFVPSGYSRDIIIPPTEGALSLKAVRSEKYGKLLDLNFKMEYENLQNAFRPLGFNSIQEVLGSFLIIESIPSYSSYLRDYDTSDQLLRIGESSLLIPGAILFKERPGAAINIASKLFDNIKENSAIKTDISVEDSRCSSNCPEFGLNGTVSVVSCPSSSLQNSPPFSIPVVQSMTNETPSQRLRISVREISIPPSWQSLAQSILLFQTHTVSGTGQVSYSTILGDGPLPTVTVCGGKSSGKSTFLRFLSNVLSSSSLLKDDIDVQRERFPLSPVSLRDMYSPGAKIPSQSYSTPPPSYTGVCFLDLDPGQPEHGLPGTISLSVVSAPLLVPTYVRSGHFNPILDFSPVHSACNLSEEEILSLNGAEVVVKNNPEEYFVDSASGSADPFDLESFTPSAESLRAGGPECAPGSVLSRLLSALGVSSRPASESNSFRFTETDSPSSRRAQLALAHCGLYAPRYVRAGRFDLPSARVVASTFVGAASFKDAPHALVRGATDLLHLYRSSFGRCGMPLLVNTAGWMQGFGLDAQTAVLGLVRPVFSVGIGAEPFFVPHCAWQPVYGLSLQKKLHFVGSNDRVGKELEEIIPARYVTLPPWYEGLISGRSAVDTMETHGSFAEMDEDTLEAEPSHSFFNSTNGQFVISPQLTPRKTSTSVSNPVGIDSPPVSGGGVPARIRTVPPRATRSPAELRSLRLMVYLLSNIRYKLGRHSVEIANNAVIMEKQQFDIPSASPTVFSDSDSDLNSLDSDRDSTHLVSDEDRNSESVFMRYRALLRRAAMGVYRSVLAEQKIVRACARDAASPGFHFAHARAIRVHETSVSIRGLFPFSSPSSTSGGPPLGAVCVGQLVGLCSIALQTSQRRYGRSADPAELAAACTPWSPASLAVIDAAVQQGFRSILKGAPSSLIVGQAKIRSESHLQVPPELVLTEEGEDEVTRLLRFKEETDEFDSFAGFALPCVGLGYVRERDQNGYLHIVTPLEIHEVQVVDTLVLWQSAHDIPAQLLAYGRPAGDEYCFDPQLLMSVKGGSNSKSGGVQRKNLKRKRLG